MPKFLEEKLKAEYGSDSSIPFKVMNKMGVMHGNKETDKGREMDAQHEADMSESITTHNQRSTRKNFHKRSNLK